jgi:hypothetical protein
MLDAGYWMLDSYSAAIRHFPSAIFAWSLWRTVFPLNRLDEAVELFAQLVCCL